MRLVLASPRGFCAGVARALSIVEELLDLYDGPIFIRHEIIHNKAVIRDLRQRGVIFVEEIDEIPEGSIAVLSAHGSPPCVRTQASQRNLRLFDATCPLVTKVHLEVARHERHGRTVVVIGHRDHVEVKGIVGHYGNPDGDGVFVVENESDAWAFEPPRPDHIGCVTQTTLATDQTRAIIGILTARFPKLILPHRQDICYATQNRQEAVRLLAVKCGLIIVVGAAHSSNTRRLIEVSERCGCRAFLVEDQADIDGEWLEGVEVVGLTSSASAPEHLVQSVIARIRLSYPELVVEEVGEGETVSFGLPPEFRALDTSGAHHLSDLSTGETEKRISHLL
jgi:4-hydroxy-3-methylbut-2-en-1-yl diphosphate reductase